MAWPRCAAFLKTQPSVSRDQRKRPPQAAFEIHAAAAAAEIELDALRADAFPSDIMAAKRAGKAKATGVVARPRYEESALWIRLLRTWHGLGAGVCVAIVLAMNIDWHLSVYARTVMFKDDNSTYAVGARAVDPSLR